MKSFYVKATEDTTQQMVEELFELCVLNWCSLPSLIGANILAVPNMNTWYGVSPQNECEIVLMGSTSSPGLILNYEEALALFEEKPEAKKPLFDSEKFEEFVKNEYGHVSISHSEKFTMIASPINFAPTLEHLDYFSEIGLEYRSYSNNQMIFKKILD